LCPTQAGKGFIVCITLNIPYADITITRQQIDKMDVLLIYPHTSTSSIEEGIKIPPLGLAYIAATLEAQGYNVGILDMNAQPQLSAGFSNILIEQQPRIVGITCLTPFYSTVLSLAKTAKECLDTTVIIGGAHATALPEEMLDGDDIDYVVLGEGEAIMSELAQSLLRNDGKVEQVRGIAFKKDGMLHHTGQHEYIQNLDELPFPARHLLPLEKYTSPQYKKANVTSIITSRGCPYSCIFCDYRFLMGPKFRRRSPENVVMEIEECLEKFDVTHFSFRDSTFTFGDSWIAAFCQAIKQRKLDISWDCNGRVNLVTENMLFAMKEAGCNMISYGIESGDQQILDFANKSLTVEQSLNAVTMTRKMGIETLCYFILGLPGENYQTINNTIAFARKLNPDYAQFSLATPFPGTPLYSYAAGNNLIRPGITWDEFSPINKAILRTRELDFEELEKSLKRAYKSYYLRPGYILKRALKLRPGNMKQNLNGLKMFTRQQKQ